MTLTHDQQIKALYLKILGFCDNSTMEGHIAHEEFPRGCLHVAQFLMVYDQIPAGIPVPDASVSEDGGIALTWNLADGRSLALEFEGDLCSYSYLDLAADKFVPGLYRFTPDRFPPDALTYIS